MTNPSLLRRIEALEAVQSPRAPIIRWKPHSASSEALTAFEAGLAATEAAHPGRPVMVIGWGDAE